MPRNFIKLFIILLTWSFSFATLGLSQSRNEVISALEQLNRDLEKVKHLVLSFNNNQAKKLVAEAQSLRDEAVTAIQNRQFKIAGVKIKSAFSLLHQAVKITLDGPVRRLRSHLEELMRQADHVVLGRRHKEAERILQEAKLNREAAEKAFLAKNFTKAVEHYRVAITLAQRAINLVQKSTNSIEQTIKEEQQRYVNLRERAREIVEKSKNRRAKQIFAQAIKLGLSAEEALRNGKFELAKSLYNQSVLLLLRAMDFAGGKSPTVRNRVGMRIDRLKNLIKDSREVFVRTRKPRVKILYERAIRFEREAELAAKEGRNYEALWKVELAGNMIRRARKIVLRKAGRRFSNKISQEIAYTKKEIKDFRRILNEDTPQDVQVLINMSQFTINKAERASAAGFNRLALEAVLASQRFLSKAERILKHQEITPISKKMIEVRLNQLNEALEEAERKVAESNQKWNRQLIDGAKDIRQIAVESFQNGNYRASDEGIQVAFELLRKSLKNLPKN